MVTTAGLHAVTGLLGNVDTPVDFTYIAFGSGTTAAAAGDTTLGTETQRKLATMKIKSILNPNDTVVYTADFVATSDGTLSEIGVFTADAAGTMLLRRLLVAPKPYLGWAKITVMAEVTVKGTTAGTGANW